MCVGEGRGPGEAAARHVAHPLQRQGHKRGRSKGVGAITHVVCRVAPPHTWAPQPGCLQQCDDGCRPRNLTVSERLKQKAQIVNSDVAALMELAESIKVTMNETRDPRREKAEYFDTIANVCPPFKAAPGAVSPDNLQRAFATMRSAAQKVGALPVGASASRGGIRFPFEVRVVPEFGRSVFPLQPVPRRAAVWEATEDNVAYFRTREQLEDRTI